MTVSLFGGNFSALLDLDWRKVEQTTRGVEVTLPVRIGKPDVVVGVGDDLSEAISEALALRANEELRRDPANESLARAIIREIPEAMITPPGEKPVEVTIIVAVGDEVVVVKACGDSAAEAVQRAMMARENAPAVMELFTEKTLDLFQRR